MSLLQVSFAYGSLRCANFTHSVSDFEVVPAENLIVILYQGKEVSTMQYEYEADVENLYIQETRTQADFRRLGFSKKLLEAALKKHPNTKTIESTLTETNEKAYAAAKSKIVSGRLDKRPTDQDNIEALKATPSYKKALAFGFSKVIQHERSDNSVLMVVGRESEDQ